MHAPNPYLELSARFRVVRRAWKRAAALSGLAVVVTESIGIFTAVLFLDWLYQPQPAARLAMAAVAMGAVVYFVVRHVIKPLLRKIPDEQIALYIEEQRSELDGILITAAEFGRKRENSSAREGSLIDAILNEAVARSGRVRIGHMIDFSRLKKYGFISAAAIALYVLLAVLFPAALTQHFVRVLQPWRATDEDLARHAAALAVAEPMRFTLSKGNASLPRGSSFDFEATLSKAKRPGDAVTLNFRPKAGGDWQKLAMTEIEKLNGFQGSLPDVSEDLDFYISCGEAKSDTYHLTVFDPLVVRSLAMTTHYPDYVKQPDRVEDPSTGDVTALAGAQCTLQLVTSTPIKAGRIKWSGGQEQDVTVDAQGVASVSFEIKQDDTYDYTLTDVNGQQAVSAAPLAVHAIPDTPPTITVKSPQGQVLTNPLGEINFDVEAGDDFGVVALDLVYTRIDAQGNEKETRVPLPYHAGQDAGVPNAVVATYRLALEEANPPFKPDDAVPYHVEARDAKGQVTSSPYGMIIVGYFEHWATYAAPMAGAEEIHDETAPDLMQMLALVWELDNQKSQIKPEDLQKRSAAIAGKLEGAKGAVVDFLNLAEHPQLARLAPVVDGHIGKAHDALMKSDTATASSQLSIAAAIVAGNGVLPDSAIEAGGSSATVVGSHSHPPAMTLLEQARMEALAAANKDQSHDEQDPAAAAATAQEVADLLKQQDDLVAHAQALVAAQSGDKKGANDDGSKDKTFGTNGAGASKDPQPAPTAADLASQQHALAEKTRAAANAQGTGANAKAASDKTAAAAKLMEEAARAFAAGKTSEGHDKATQAQSTLQAVNDDLQNTDRDKLAAAIGDAESHAALLLEKQKELAAKTDALAKELGGKAPDQRQQRDFKEQAYEQTQFSAQAEALDGEITHLSDQAQKVGQQDAIRALGDAQHVVRRNQPQAKLAGAAVDLNNGNPASASGEQKQALDAVQKLADNLQSGSDALAASREAQLTRANRVAQEAKKGLNSLLGKAQSPSAPQGDKAGAGASEAGNGGNRLDEARKLAYNLTQLASVIDNRQLIPQEEVDKLKEMGLDKSELEKRLTVDPKFLGDVAGVVSRISDKIEAELEAKTEAGKLFSSQREECPPNYRPFVNKYFEALSQVAPPATPGSQNPPAPEATSP